MSSILLPEINYNSFSATRDVIQLYAQLLSAIKGQHVPHQKNWEEYSLKVYAKGFTTGPIPIETNDGVEALDLNLNLIEHKLKIFFGSKRDEIDLHQSSIESFTEKFVEKIYSYGISEFKPEDKFLVKDELVYDESEAKKMWDTFRQIYFILLEFRGSTLFETSNINFWPHHFDLALLIFSGKLIDGKDTKDWDNSREQMNFGFSSGDDGVGQPYFYVTAYPFDEKLFDLPLPEFADWQKDGWKGAVIKLSKINELEDIKNNLLRLFNDLLNKNFADA